MPTDNPMLFALDLLGTFAFALNGALTALRAARLDIVGVVTLGMITAIGGGVIRDVLIGDIAPAAFGDWRYLGVAVLGSLLAFFFNSGLGRLSRPIVVLDAVGLSLFAVVGASKALDYGLGPVPAVMLGAITAVGGGTLRDVLTLQVPTVLRSELYAIPALLGACLVVVSLQADLGSYSAVGAAAACFALRMVGVRFDLHAPGPPGLAPRE